MNRPDICVRFQGSLGTFAIDAAFSVPSRGVTGLFGPSGSGKTSILRGIAGLHYFPNSLCRIGDAVWQNEKSFLRPHERPVGYVFQEASLFPHLDVRKNLLFGAGRDPDASLFEKTVTLLGLDKLIDRSPRHLSGGERQRVAIGRALMSRPKLLLMDEPLSALDRGTKNEILPFLQTLSGSTGLPVIYVSHDMREIERLADHLVLMDSGQVTASGPLAELQANPVLPLAQQRDASITLEGHIIESDSGDGLMTVGVGRHRIQIPRAAVDGHAALRIHVAAGDVSLSLAEPHGTSITNLLPAKIRSLRAMNDSEVLALLELDPDDAGLRLLARVTQRSVRALALAPGMTVIAQVKGVSLRY